jgi:putative FmdB family regulatory protein
MPIYEYECTKCGKIEEAVQKISDTPLTECRYCSGQLHKLISQSTFHLKGTGWYVTDYNRSSNYTSASTKKEASSSPPESGGASTKDSTSSESLK